MCGHAPVMTEQRNNAWMVARNQRFSLGEWDGNVVDAARLAAGETRIQNRADSFCEYELPILLLAQ